MIVCVCVCKYRCRFNNRTQQKSCSVRVMMMNK